MGEVEYYSSNVNDDQLELLEPLLPVAKKQPGRSGRPPRDRREVLNGIFYVNYSGCPWRYLPKTFGHWGTVYTYFNRWSKTGFWGHYHGPPARAGKASSGPSQGALGGLCGQPKCQNITYGYSRGYAGVNATFWWTPWVGSWW
jgi:transposase